MFVPNPAFGKLYEATQEGREKLAEAAEEAKERAEQFSPERTGAYKGSFEVRNEPTGVYLVNTDFKAHWIEWGTVDTPAHAPLRRGALSAGLRFTDASK